MRYKIYGNNIYKCWIKAHEALWNGENTLSIKDQIRLYKEIYHIDVSGGPYDNTITTRPICLNFESKEAYVLFMLEWS